MNKLINMRKIIHSGENLICEQEKLSRHREFEGYSGLKGKSFSFQSTKSSLCHYLIQM